MKWTQEEIELLKEFRKQRFTILEIANELNRTEHSIRKKLQTENIVLEKIINTCINCGTDIKNKKYCSNTCQRDFEYKERISKWKTEELSGVTGKNKKICNWLRKYLLEKYNNSCVKCGWNNLHPIDNLPLVEINHIDGNADNNKESNLEVLCPNCHSMTSNFRARNNNSARER